MNVKEMVKILAKNGLDATHVRAWVDLHGWAMIVSKPTSQMYIAAMSKVAELLTAHDCNRAIRLPQLLGEEKFHAIGYILSLSRKIDMGAVIPTAQEWADKILAGRQRAAYLENKWAGLTLAKAKERYTIQERPDSVQPVIDLYGRAWWSCSKGLSCPLPDAWSQDVMVDNIAVPVIGNVIDVGQGLVAYDFPEDERQRLLATPMGFLIGCNDRQEYDEVIEYLLSHGCDIEDSKNCPSLGALCEL